MAKKVVKTFSANLNKNPEKGGAWMAIISVTTEGIDGTETLNMAAWSNASAGKRWVKSQGKDAKGKPTSFVGVVTFRS